ncbi:MAG TPA: hypothetical protein VFW33_11290 [Gemmataceae bacterium]|nr:hypothetical protein [Gemmataceae bacterium]
MPTDRIAFDAIRTACWRDNGRQYRVFLRDGELLFLYVGRAAGSRPIVTGSAGIEGVVVAVIASAVWWWRREKIKGSERSFNAANEDDLLALSEEEGSFRVPVAEIDAVAVRSRSFWLTLLYAAGDHAGVLRFTHPTRGRLTFALPTGHDLLTVFESLRPLLGERLAVSIV